MIYWHKKRKDQYYQFDKAQKAYCKKRYKKAVNWLRKAAEQGNAAAQNNLGCCYDSGQGVEQNYIEAVQWFMKAVEQGDAFAQCNLGFCYIEGHGVERNLDKAKELFEKVIVTETDGELYEKAIEGLKEIESLQK